MSKRLAEFPDTRRAEMYNWREWLDGEAHLLQEGEDFEVSYDSFRASAHQAAKRHHLKVKVKKLTEGDIVHTISPTGSKVVHTIPDDSFMSLQAIKR